MRRSRATACAEVGPAGLNTLTNPSKAALEAFGDQRLLDGDDAVG
jgi:hypothetical protein